MHATVSSLYASPIPLLETRLTKAIEDGLTAGNGEAVVFFRADDIGVPSQSFFDMLALFRKYNMPLCLAVVPAWLTSRRRKILLEAAGNSNRFCWHQHGWRHKNHERFGKKQEFGENRPAVELQHDLIKGRDRLSRLIGSRFFPVFTPPWNRCGKKTLILLEELGFRGISRSSGAMPPVSPGFSDIQINVDLHTRKEPSPSHSLDALLTELTGSMSSGTSGIMLHHQRMNEHALFFLDRLLQAIRRIQKIQPLHFQDLLE